MSLKKTSREFAFFTMAAALSALSDIAVFTLLVHSGLFFIYCQAVSRIVGGAVSFFINKHFSFDRHEGRTLIEIRRFLLLYAVSYTLSFVLLWFAHQRWGLRLLYAKPLADGTCFLFNFAVMKLYVYAPLRGLIFRIRALLWLGKGAVDDSLRG